MFGVPSEALALILGAHVAFVLLFVLFRRAYRLQKQSGGEIADPRRDMRLRRVRLNQQLDLYTKSILPALLHDTLQDLLTFYSLTCVRMNLSAQIGSMRTCRV
jgi:hypothetical protein